MKFRIITLMVALAFSGSAAAWLEGGGERDEALDLEPDMENGLDVYEVCSGCHLPEGWGKADGTFPQLAGQHRSVLIKQLADIREQVADPPVQRSRRPHTAPPQQRIEADLPGQNRAAAVSAMIEFEHLLRDRVKADSGRGIHPSL